MRTHTNTHVNLYIAHSHYALCTGNQFIASDNFITDVFELSNSYNPFKTSVDFDHLCKQANWNELIYWKKKKKMISNGYKVIGIEENGNVKYDVTSSCPVSNLQCHMFYIWRKNCTVLLLHDNKWLKINFFSFLSEGFTK